MARVATKAADNVWYRARIHASKEDDRFRSRAGAAEVLGMCESAIAETELGISKVMPPDKADVMICGYKDTSLAGHYCKEECPLGKYVNVSPVGSDLSSAVVRLLSDIGDANDFADELLKIAYDGEVTDEENDRFGDITDRLNHLAVSISQIRAIRDSRELVCGNR